MGIKPIPMDMTCLQGYILCGVEILRKSVMCLNDFRISIKGIWMIFLATGTLLPPHQADRHELGGPAARFFAVWTRPCGTGGPALCPEPFLAQVLTWGFTSSTMGTSRVQGQSQQRVPFASRVGGPLSTSHCIHPLSSHRRQRWPERRKDLEGVTNWC